MNGPRIIGLTGSIGMGKSTVADMFADAGVPVFDADATVRRLQTAHGPLVAPIEAAFPGSTCDGAVLRSELGAAVFGKPEALARLEAIVHPAVAQERERFLARNADAEMVVFDIPLLFEKGGAEHVDTVVVVSAPPDVQRDRVLAREGMNPARFESILALQTPDAEKRRLADHVIDTGVQLGETREAVRALIETLRAGR